MKRSYLSAACALGIVAALVSVAQAATVAQWDFEDGVAGQAFTPAGEANGSAGSADLVGGVIMYGWNEEFGPAFSAAGDSPSGAGLSLDANGGQDGYVWDAGLVGWTPEQWTIETTLKMRDLGIWETFIGRDGASHAQLESDFYLQKKGIDSGDLRLDFHTAGGQKVVIDSGFVPVVDQWFQAAAVSDGSTVTLWINGGSGYAPMGAPVALTGTTAAENALAGTGNWTFMRGWYNGGFGDHVDGNMDNVRFSDVALESSEFIAIPEPSTLLLGGLGLLVVAGRRRRA